MVQLVEAAGLHSVKVLVRISLGVPMNYIILFLWFTMGLLSVKHLHDSTKLLDEWHDTLIFIKVIGVLIAPRMLFFILFFDIMSYDRRK